jgi:hypothetical protein
MADRRPPGNEAGEPRNDGGHRTTVRTNVVICSHRSTSSGRSNWRTSVVADRRARHEEAVVWVAFAAAAAANPHWQGIAAKSSS